MTIDEQKKALRVLSRNKQTPWSIGSRKAAELLGCGKTKALEILTALRGNDNPKKSKAATSAAVSETHETIGDKWNITIPQTRICTLEQLLEHCNVDLRDWTVERFVCNRWEVGAKGEGEDLVIAPLFQIKATLVKAKGLTTEAIKEEIESLKREAKSSIKAPIAPKRDSLKSGNCLEVSIFDAHLGRLSWGDETLWANYDLNIAATEYDKAVDELLNRCGHKLDRILYVVGNDLIHVDNAENTTTKGTPQDTDGRFHKVFRRTRLVIQKQIEKMRKIAPVDVLFVPGNHDTLSTWHLGDSIECFYANVKDVNVFNSPAPRKYYQWGVNGLMFCHGDKGKHKNYPLLMATENPKMWSSTKFHEIHCGHYHQLKVEEQVGCRVRIIPALCPADNWHSQNGYVGNVRAAQGFVWNDKEGLIATAEYSIVEE